MTLLFEVNGVDAFDYLKEGTLTHEVSGIARRATLSCTLLDMPGLDNLQTVEWDDSDGTHFLGFISSITRKATSKRTQGVEQTVTCRDISFRAYDLMISSLHGRRTTYEFSDDIVDDIVGYHWPEVSLTNVTAHVTIKAQDWTQYTVGDFLDAIANQAGAIWYVDADLDLYFIVPAYSAAPFNLSDVPNGTTLFSWEHGSLELGDEAEELNNRIYTRGVNLAYQNYEDADSITRYGVRYGSINSTSITTRAEMDAAAAAMLAEKAWPKREGSCTILEPGLTSGMEFALTAVDHELSAAPQYTVSVTTKYPQWNSPRYAIKFVGDKDRPIGPEGGSPPAEPGPSEPSTPSKTLAEELRKKKGGSNVGNDGCCPPPPPFQLVETGGGDDACATFVGGLSFETTGEETSGGYPMTPTTAGAFPNVTLAMWVGIHSGDQMTVPFYGASDPANGQTALAAPYTLLTSGLGGYHEVIVPGYRAVSSGSPGSFAPSYAGGSAAQAWATCWIDLPLSAIAPVQSGIQNSTGSTVTLSAAPTAGNILVAQYAANIPTAGDPGNITGWTKLGYTELDDGGVTDYVMAVYVRCADGTETATFTCNPGPAYSHWTTVTEWAVNEGEGSVPSPNQDTAWEGATATGSDGDYVTNYPYQPGSLIVTANGVVVVPDETDPTAGEFTIPNYPAGTAVAFRYQTAYPLTTGANHPPASPSDPELVTLAVGRWEPVTNGDVGSPEVVFEAGDIVMEFVT